MYICIYTVGRYILKVIKNIPILLYCILLTSQNTTAQKDSSIFNKLNVEWMHYNNDFLDDKRRNIIHITQDRFGSFWIGTTAGVYIFDGKNAYNFTQILRDTYNFNLPKGEYRQSIRDDNGHIWLASFRGLYVFDTKSKTLELIDSLNASNNDTKSVEINKLHPNGDFLYVCTWQGFYIIDMRTAQPISKHLWGENSLHPELKQNKIYSIYPDNQDKIIWGCSDNGMFRIDRESNQTEIYHMTPKEDITGLIHPDRYFFYQGFFQDSQLLFPTYDVGMTYFDTINKSFKSVLIEPDPTRPGNSQSEYNRIKSVLPYSKNECIILTYRHGLGLFNLEHKEYEFSKYNLRYGNSHELIKDRHGYIRYERGITDTPIYPKQDSIQYHLEITSIETSDSSYYLPHILGFPKDLSIPSKEYFLKIHFGLIDYPEIDSVSYEYRINDAKWISIEQNTCITNPKAAGKHNIVTIRAVQGNHIIDEAHFPFIYIKPFHMTVWFYATLSAISSIFIILIWNWRKEISYRHKREKDDLLVRISEMEAKKLKNQLNPHFIFNSLNSIKYFVNNGKYEYSAQYITNFAIFIRNVLHYSEEDQISLEEEIELCCQYLELEKLRFDRSFEYSIESDDTLDLDFIQVPSLLFQPILENSIWHGLLHKDGHRQITMQFHRRPEGVLCMLEDNGVGRSNIKDDRRTKKGDSIGLHIFEERLQLYNEINNTRYSYTIVDKMQNGKPSGTRFEIQLTT